MDSKIKVPKVQFKHQFPIIFYNKSIMQTFWKFLTPEDAKKLKLCLRKTGVKEQKKKIKEIVKNYIIDFGKHSEKVKFSINDEGVLTIITTIFNIRKDYLKIFTHIKYNKEVIHLEKKELYQYLHVFPKNEIYLSNNESSIMRLSKPLIPYDTVYSDDEEDTPETSKNESKYEMFYHEDNLDDLKNIDFSNRELLIERQKKMLEQLNKVTIEEFYPLKFISNVNYWSIILCEGGYFAYGCFLKDQLIEHKSDHKYVIRKKAGQRQIVKDKAKKIKSSIGAQIRRANEKKHQENIEYILKLNEENLLKSDCIFVQAPGVNKSILIGDDRSLASYKKKILNIPFSVPRANFSNIMYVYKRITNVYFEIKDEKVNSLFK